MAQFTDCVSKHEIRVAPRSEQVSDVLNNIHITYSPEEGDASHSRCLNIELPAFIRLKFIAAAMSRSRDRPLEGKKKRAGFVCGRV